MIREIVEISLPNISVAEIVGTSKIFALKYLIIRLRSKLKFDHYAFVLKRKPDTTSQRSLCKTTLTTLKLEFLSVFTFYVELDNFNSCLLIVLAEFYKVIQNRKLCS